MRIPPAHLVRRAAFLCLITLFGLFIGSSFADDAKPQTLTLVNTDTVNLRIYDMQFSDDTNFTGKLALSIPQNQLPAIDISGTYDVGSDALAVDVPNLPALRMAGASFQLTGVKAGRSSLTAEGAVLNLPEKLGSVEAALGSVVIDQNGLRIGEGSVDFTLPDLKLGGSNGFTLSGARGNFTLGADRSYKLNVSGSVALKLPGNSVSATGSIWLDSAGGIGGKLDAFALNVAGLSLEINDVDLRDDGSLAIAKAAINAPPQWRGGPGAEVNNLVIAPTAPYITFSSAKVVLPTIKAGGFSLGSVVAELATEGDGFALSGAGSFSLPSVGAPGCTGFDVKVSIYVQPGTNTAVLDVGELTPAAQREYHQQLQTYGIAPAGEGAFALREAALAVSCNIPIPQTPFFITGVRGSVTLTSDVVSVKVGLEISAGTKVAGVSILSADGEVTLSAKPLELAVAGTIKVLGYSAAGATASINTSGFTGTIYLDVIAARGNVTIKAWVDGRGTHLAGSGMMEVGIPKGKIYSAGSGWFSITVPPSDLKLGSVLVEAGEFRNGQWGFKGTAEIGFKLIKYRKGFFIDTAGNISFTNVDNYQLLTPQQVLMAQAAWKLSGARGAQLSEVAVGEQRLAFADSGEVLVSAPIAGTRDATFLLARGGSEPSFSLVRPDGTRITPDADVDGVAYDETTSYTGPRYPGIEASGPDTKSHLRFVQALPTTGTLQLDAGQGLGTLFSDVRFGTVTGYTAQNPATYQISVAQQGGATLTLPNVALEQDKDYTVVAVSRALYQTYLPAVVAGGGSAGVNVAAGRVAATALRPGAELVVLPDDNTLPNVGAARLRLVNLFYDVAKLNLVATSGPGLSAATPILADVAFRSADRYTELAPGTYDLELRGNGQTWLKAGGVKLEAGGIYSLFASGGAGERTLTAHLDAQAIQEVDATYYVDSAEGGEWKMALCCNIADDSYIATYLTDVPGPELSDVAVQTLPGNRARVSWRVTSPDDTAVVNIYANDGAITQELEAGVSVELYDGEELITGIDSPVDGSAQSVEVDLSQLTSGSYHIYVEVEDSRNEPIQLYAPGPIGVDNSGSWPASWGATVTTTPTLDLNSPGVELVWEPLDHPDVDQYRVYWGMAPGILSEEVLTDDATYLAIDALDQGDTIHLVIGAYDSETDREVRSQAISVAIPVADFSLSATKPSFSLLSGDSEASELTLTTPLATYPEDIYLEAGETLPEGIEIDFGDEFVVPSVAGANVPITISVSSELPSGTYTLPIVATGGGATHTLDLEVTVIAPSYDLSLSTGAITLNGAVPGELTISATGSNGESAMIFLEVLLADDSPLPPGLSADFVPDVIAPGETGLLRLSNGGGLPSGTYSLKVVGDNGEQVVAKLFTVTVP